MYTGVIVENSLTDLAILKDFITTHTWADGNWILHKVHANEAQVKQLAKFLSAGPWYSHFWESNREDGLVVYKDTIFPITYSDKKTWQAAIEYGCRLKIPLEQLDFLVDQEAV